MENDKFLNTLLDDRYQMMEVIGRGGMAVIYKALDTRLNRYVAIKVLREDIATDPELLADFTSEAQAIAKLTHPNIVAVYDVVSSPGGIELERGIALLYQDCQGIGPCPQQGNYPSGYQTPERDDSERRQYQGG